MTDPMTLDTKALREAAEDAANRGSMLAYQAERAHLRFRCHATPATILALLDRLEKAEASLAVIRPNYRPDWVDPDDCEENP